MFSSQDLKWVKNVKRNHGDGWAYDNVRIGDYFNLHWSKKFKGNVLKPNTNDLILLFQSLNNPKNTFLTHIVTPVDQVVIEDDNNPTHPYARLVCAVAVANPISSIPKPPHLDFFRPNRGAACNLETIKDMGTKADILLPKLQRSILDLFSEIDLDIKNLLNSIPSMTTEEVFEEGSEFYLLSRHKYYERNAQAVKRAKALAKKEHRLYCEICRFDFKKKYGALGEGFIECHHKKPIAEGGKRETKLKDLAIVCSNCHRMLHRKFNGHYYTVEELNKLLCPDT